MVLGGHASLQNILGPLPPHPPPMFSVAIYMYILFCMSYCYKYEIFYENGVRKDGEHSLNTR